MIDDSHNAPVSYNQCAPRDEELNELHEEIDLTPEDEAALAMVNADGEISYLMGMDAFNPRPFHLIAKHGRERAIELLKNPANRTPKRPLQFEGSG